jgi:cobalt-zinc-cadmium efflux system outer membrane protein
MTGSLVSRVPELITMKFCIKILGLLISLPALCSAQEMNPAKPISLEQVIVQVLENSPQLAAADYEAKAAAARIRQASLGTPWLINVEVENFAGSGFTRGVDGVETTLSVARILELGNKAMLRGEMAKQSASLMNREQDVQRLELLAEAGRRYIHVITDQERLLLARQAVGLAQKTVDAVQLRVDAGKTPIAERRRVAIELARAELELEHAEHELRASRMNLTTLWGETQQQAFTAQEDLFALTAIPEFSELARKLNRNPELTRFASIRSLDEARVRLAESSRRSNIMLSGGLRYLATTDDVALVASASIPLGSARRSESRIEESRLTAQRNPQLMEQRRLELYAVLFEIYQELGHAQLAVRTLQEIIIPQAELALKDYENGYAAGRFSLLELTEAQRVLLGARLEAVMAAGDFHNYQIEIERLTGARLTEGASS